MRRVALLVLCAFLVAACLPIPGAAPPLEPPSGYPPEALKTAQAPDPPALREALRGGRSLVLTAGVYDPLHEKAPQFPSCDSPVRGDGRFRLVQFSTDLNASDRAALARDGLAVLDYVPGSAYVIRAAPAQFERLRLRPDFRWMDVLRGPYKVDPLLMAPGWRGPLAVTFRLFPNENPFSLLQRLQAFEPGAAYAAITGEPSEGQSLRVLLPAERMHPFLEIASEDESVWSVSPWFLPRLLNDNSIWVIQSDDTVNRLDYSRTATIWNHGITGTGQVVCINDSGIDDDSCQFRYSADPSSIAQAQYPALPDPGVLDFTKKIVAYAVLPGSQPYDGFAFFDHGTHTSGTAAGDNYATLSTPTSGGHDFGDGMAPNAKIFFQDSGNEASGILAGLTNDYALIFQQAYNAGARIHSDSWGSSTAGTYTADCSDVDRYLWRNEAFQLFFANGNNGPLAGTVGSPAAAKNCVSVGALTNGSANANDVTSFSSRGPTRDGRIKPDVCAPGDEINSALGDGQHDTNGCATVTMSGTSMATPTAAGGAVLLRQYFTDGFYPTGARNGPDALVPSGALVKAALVNGAMDVGQPDAPNFLEGFGRIQLDNVCFFSTPSRDVRKTRLWDRWNAAGLTEGQTESFPLEVAQGQPLKVVLVWTDPAPSPLAASELVNDLNLTVVSPDGKSYLGNVLSDGASMLGGAADVLNNVEVVNVRNPAAGTWVLKVSAAHVPGNPLEAYSDHQGFALVATYADCVSALTAPGDLSARDTGQTGIELGWTGVDGAASYQVYRAAGSCGQDPGEFHYAGQTTGTTYSDPLVQGGYPYAYVVRAADACSEGPASACAGATYSRDCTLFPVFSGLDGAENDTSAPSCAVRLSWSPAASRCPLAPGISYNVYRGTSPYFTPDPERRLAKGLAGTFFLDDAVAPLVTYYYVVRAEDATSGNGGPANGGNEDPNGEWRSATPSAATSSPGDWTDDGGDTRALLNLEPPWTVTNQDNHTPGGLLCYHSAPDGQTYPANRCASATTSAVPIQAEGSLLTYWARYNLEQFWDGVVVEVSDDGGATWNPSDPAGGYSSGFDQTGDPPINACAFPASQKCFNGPAGNTALTPWTLYKHDLSAYAGRSVQVRWRFSSDPGGEYEGFYLDDIRLSGAGIPDPCVGHPDQPPQVTLLSPSDASTVHGYVAITAQVTDDHGLAEVQFLVDGESIATLLGPPFDAVWDGSGLNGAHTIAVRAKDDLGQTTTTSAITVTASNPTAESVKKLKDPFRLALNGAGFQEGCVILVSGTQAPATARKSDRKAIAQKGSALKSLIPQGSEVPVVLMNPDGGRTAPVLVGR